MVNTNNSEFEFMTKKELLESLGNEKLSIKSEIEERLNKFNDDDVLSIEISVNSPAMIIDIKLLNGSIVDFINSVFEKEGISKEVVNKAFGELST